MSNGIKRSENFIAIPPGATIKEQLEYKNMSQKEFALRMDLSEKHVSRLINGKVELTCDTAIRLESVTGLPASFWSGLESKFREQLKKVDEESRSQKELFLLHKYPYSILVENNSINDADSDIEKIRNLRKFLEVSNLSIVDELYIPGISSRKDTISSDSYYHSLCWAQQVRILGRNISVSKINKKKLMGSIDNIKMLSMKNPEEFNNELIEILSDCGIALVYLNHFGESGVNGATFVDGEKIVLGLSVRGNYADSFWFSLFHELYHIIAGDVFRKDITDLCEESADVYARNQLIPEDLYRDFIKRGDFEKDAILYFATINNIEKGIVVGRLQKDNHINKDQFNDLRTKYSIQ